MTDWTSLTYAVVDVEGNGQAPPELVELAIVPITGGVVGTPTTWLVRPQNPISPFARKIHGISNEAVADAPVFDEIQGEVRQALDGMAFVAHNAHVDVAVLRRQLHGWEPGEVVDTLKLARRLLPRRVSYRLGALVDLFNLAGDFPLMLRPHRATYDALVTAHLFVRLATLVPGEPVTLEALRGDPFQGGRDDAQTLF